MDNYYSRGILLKLQDRLSDNDRRRLHFFLGNDVPRRIRDDPSLSGTLSLMESLFDQDKINERDYTFLINAFNEIHCIDAVKLLREHMRRMQSNGANQSTHSLASIMPQTLDQLLEDQEDDKRPTKTPLLDDANSSDETNILLESEDTNLQPMTVTVDNATTPLSRLRRKELLNLLSAKYKYLLFSILLLIISVGILAGFCLERSIRIEQLRKNLMLKEKLILEEETKNNQTIEQLNNQLKDLGNEKNNSLIKAGLKFGGNGGKHFDDSLTNNFTSSHYLSGIVIQRDWIYLDWIQFLYSTSNDDRSLLEAQVHGISQKSETTRFILGKDEKIFKVVGKFLNVTMYVNGIALYNTVLIRGVQFFTTKGRASQAYDQISGETFTEELNGYTLGYVTGRDGTYVDSLQFFWYRTPLK